MARPKDPVEKSYQFHSRLTPGEGAAVEEMVRRWAAENPLTPGDRTTWFRTIVRREAEKMKIAIVEPASVAAPSLKTLTKKGSG